MDKDTALDKVRARLERLRNKIRSRRKQIINEAMELFDIGLDTEDVYDELRDYYVDSVPLWSQKADALVDFTRILPNLAGEILVPSILKQLTEASIASVKSCTPLSPFAIRSRSST